MNESGTGLQESSHFACTTRDAPMQARTAIGRALSIQRRTSDCLANARSWSPPVVGRRCANALAACTSRYRRDGNNLYYPAISMFAADGAKC